jgi:hypothetical protein
MDFDIGSSCYYCPAFDSATRQSDNWNQSTMNCYCYRNKIGFVFSTKVVYRDYIFGNIDESTVFVVSTFDYYGTQRNEFAGIVEANQFVGFGAVFLTVDLKGMDFADYSLA